MDTATTRKRSFDAAGAVEVIHRPSGVASASSFWKTQRKTAPRSDGWMDNPSPWYCAPALAPSSDQGIGTEDLGSGPVLMAGAAEARVKVALCPTTPSARMAERRMSGERFRVMARGGDSVRQQIGFASDLADSL